MKPQVKSFLTSWPALIILLIVLTEGMRGTTGILQIIFGVAFFLFLSMVIPIVLLNRRKSG